MRRFLSDELDDADGDAVEERFMTDSAFFESLAALEHEMMADLVAGRLPARWAGPFAAAVRSSPARQKRLDELRQLMIVLPAGRRRDWKQLMAIAATLAVVAAGSLLWSRWRTVPAPAGDARPPAASVPVVATSFLQPGPARSSDDRPNVFEIAAGVARVRFVALLDTPPGTPVEARIRPVGGAEIELPPNTESRPAPGGLEVSWELPAASLTAGDYLIAYSRGAAGSAVNIETRFVRITKALPPASLTPGR